MDTMSVIEGLAGCAFVITMITFAIMATSGPFKRDESCELEEKNDEK